MNWQTASPVIEPTAFLSSPCGRTQEAAVHLRVIHACMHPTTINKDVPPVVIPSTNNIIVQHSQRGNPVLECIRNVGKEFGDIVADYQVGKTTGVLFLSLKYHRLHPEYVHTRIEKLGHAYNLRILLILCDISEHREPIRELTKACLINNITIIVAFSSEEVGQYLTTFKQSEFRSASLIKERAEKDYLPILRTTLTSISKVNKTDVETLRTSFGSFANISRATGDQLENLPGFGKTKVANMKNAFEKPFRKEEPRTIPQAAHNKVVDELHISKAGGSKAGRLSDALFVPDRAPVCPPIQEPSPEWDIEHENLPAMGTRVFDIELDL